MARPLTFALTILGVAFLATAPAALAQDPAGAQGAASVDLSLEELLNTKISVSSTKGESVLESSSAVTIIDRRMLEQYSFRDLGEALEAVAGVTVMRSYFLQGMITSRGILQDLYANKNLLLIDGVPSWHAISGESRPERISLNDIERIEILKGPASVLYGSQAYTVAINVVTRKAKSGAHNVDAYAGFGSGSAYEYGGNARATTEGGVEFAFGANVRQGQRIDYDFLDENKVMGVVTDYLDTTNATASIEYAGHSAMFNVYDTTMGSFGSAPGYRTGANTPHLASGLLAAYQFDRTFGKASVLARAFYDKSYREFMRDPKGLSYSPIDGYRSGGTARVNYSVTPTFSVEAGGDYEYRQADQATTLVRATGVKVDGMVDKHMTEKSVLAQADWKPGRWRVVVGTRYSDNSAFGGNSSWRGTVGYRVNDQNSVKVVAGQSYRSPSLFEIYQDSPNISGNPELKPETSDSVEAVYQFARGGLYAQVIGYWAEYQNKILRQRGVPPANAPNPKAPVFYANGNAFSAVGTEIEVKYVSVDKGSCFVNIDIVQGTDDDMVIEQPGNYEHYNFRYVPTFNASAGASRRFGPFNVSAVVGYTSETEGPFGPVDAWSNVQVNAFYEHKLAGGFTARHTVSGRNVFDSSIAFPEYSRRRAIVNEIPWGADPGVFYTFAIRY